MTPELPSLGFRSQPASFEGLLLGRLFTVSKTFF